MQRFADSFFLSHYPRSDCRLQESLLPGQSPHHSVHADNHSGPSATEEQPITRQQEERHIVGETIPQSQPTSLALVGPIYPVSPPHIESCHSTTPPCPPRPLNEDEEMDYIGGQNTPASESRDSTPRPRLLWKGKGRMIYSDDSGEMENAGGSSERPTAPQGRESQESQRVRVVTFTAFSNDNSLLA